MAEALLIERTEAAVTLCLNRPAVRNAFDDALIAELNQALAQLAEDDRCRVLVLAASGEVFSAGADLNWMRRMARYSEAENHSDALALARLMQSLAHFPKPTLARVQGAAFGGGVGLVACCDIAVAVESACFSLSEVHLGLIPAVISPHIVHSIGAKRTRRLALTGERINAEQALQFGLIDAIATPDDLDHQLAHFIKLLCRGGPQAQQEVKQLITHIDQASRNHALLYETAARIARVRVSAEGQEGLAAFLEQRPTAWQLPDVS